MNLEFDFNDVKTVEFGVGRKAGKNQTFCLLPVDGSVQQALREMASTTWTAMQELTDSPPRYDPSEKHEPLEYVHLPLGDDLAAPMWELHQAVNLPLDAVALSDPATVFAYFARMTDGAGRSVTALRRATQFKGVLKSRLIQLVTDAWKIVEDRVFKLDTDFDLMIDAKHVHILRPGSFEFAGGLQDAVLQAVPKNVEAIQVDLPFVEFAGIGDYAAKHPRAARYLASVRGQAETKNIDNSNLKKLCEATGVEVQDANGRIAVAAGHEMAFLEVLDRRRYEVELVKDSPERFRAASRRKIES